VLGSAARIVRPDALEFATGLRAVLDGARPAGGGISERVARRFERHVLGEHVIGLYRSLLPAEVENRVPVAVG
jgi:hypothetical protein